MKSLTTNQKQLIALKKKYYKVVEFTGDNKFESFNRATFDTKIEAIAFIHEFEGSFYQLTILEVWE